MFMFEIKQTCNRGLDANPLSCGETWKDPKDYLGVYVPCMFALAFWGMPIESLQRWASRDEKRNELLRWGNTRKEHKSTCRGESRRKLG